MHQFLIAVAAVLALSAAWCAVQDLARRWSGKPSDCDMLAESDCRHCALHEACGVRHREETGEPACRLN